MRRIAQAISKRLARPKPRTSLEPLREALGLDGSEARSLLAASKAQLGQDIFALSELGFKRDGFFVEFGATNGVELSNTYLLEKQFGWSGILAEPARRWHRALRRNRACRIETRCVWRESHATLAFHEARTAELSTIVSFTECDHLRDVRRRGKRYPVETVSLGDLLAAHGAPKRIDYLSIDTEGSEYDILQAFDFGSFDVRVITCEHGFRPSREQMFSLLTANGYIRKLEHVSQFDDWYVKAS